MLHQRKKKKAISAVVERNDWAAIFRSRPILEYCDFSEPVNIDHFIFRIEKVESHKKWLPPLFIRKNNDYNQASLAFFTSIVQYSETIVRVC